MSCKLMKRTLGCLLAMTTLSMSVPADAMAGTSALPTAVDETGNLVELTGVDGYGNGIVRVDKELDISTDSAYEDPNWVENLYPLDVLIVEPDPDVAAKRMEEAEKEALREVQDVPPVMEDAPYDAPYLEEYIAPDEGEYIDVDEDSVSEGEYVDDTWQDEYVEDESDSLFMAALGDFEYSLSNDVATITKYTGSDEDITIPEEVDGYTVVGIGNQAFRNKTGIKSVSMPFGITTIGDSAFSGCSALETVELSDNVTTIGQYAFSNSALNSIELPEGLLKIGAYAFNSVSSLEEITIPSTVTSIGTKAFYNSVKKVIFAEGIATLPDSAFSNATNLEEVVLPDTVTKINRYAFNGCNNLTQINIPSGVTEISDYAFAGCTSLSSVTLPDGLEKIGGSAFRNDGSLTELTIPSSIRTMGGKVFYGSVQKITVADGLEVLPSDFCNGATNLETVILPDSLVKIGSNAFYECSKLSSIDLPENITEIGSYAFYKCTTLSDISLPSGLNKIGSYSFCNDSALEQITIPSGIKTIEGNAFGSSVKKVTFEEGITVIPNNALNNAGLLETVVIPDTVEKIGNNAFYQCSKLNNVILPSSLTEIGNYAFYKCVSLDNISLPDGLITIGGNVFQSDAKLIEITIPKTVTSIGSNSFSGSVKKIIFEEGTTVIPKNVCNGASLLETVVIPDTVTTIGEYAFSYCKSLSSFDVPKGVTTIGRSAFYSCPLLTEFVIPSTVTSIGDSAFYGSVSKITFGEGTTQIVKNACYGASLLETVVIPETVTAIGDYAFYNCSKLTGFEIPETVTSVGAYAFSGCSKLTELTIPKSLTVIGNNAFYNSVKKIIFAEGTTQIADKICYSNYYLEEVVIPDTVKSIGKEAFYQCTRLKDIELPDSIETIGEKSFYGCAAIETIVFPVNLKTIANSAFYGCKALIAITLPEGLTAIGESAFYNCSSVVSALIPSTVTTIGRSAFYNSAKGIIFAEGIKKIPDSACDGANTLEKVSIPSGVEEIGDRAFYGCTLLEEILLPEGLKKVGEKCFYGDTSLKVYLPDSLVTMGDDAYAGCIVAKKCGRDSEWQLNYEDKTVTVTGTGEIGNDKGNVFSTFTDEIEFIQVEDGITEISDHSFEGMDNLAGIVVGDSVKNIGVEAFGDCESLERVELSKDLESIEENAFRGSEAVETIIFTGDMPNIDDTALPSENFTAYYPKSYDSYDDSVKNKYNYVVWKEWDDTLPERDIVLVLDVSGSMSGKRITNLKTAVCAFADKVGGRLSNTRISIVTYASEAKTVMPFSTDIVRMKAATRRMSANGGTQYLKGYAEAEKLLSDSGASVKSLILFSDGEPSDSHSSILSKSENFRDEGIYLYSVGLSPTASARTLLINIAGDEDNYFEAENIDELISRFVEVSKDIGRSGSCGDNVRWKYYDSSKQLIISLDNKLSGEGKMQDFSEETAPDWNVYADTLEKIIIEDGVTYLGKNAFSSLLNVSSVQIVASVTGIGDGAFGNSSKLSTVYFTGTEEQWKKIVIGDDNDALKKATIKYNSEDPDKLGSKVTGLKVKPATVTLEAGQKTTLAAEVSPRNARNKSVTWSSSDPKVVSVSSYGVVQAVNVGTATVTAESAEGGYKAACNVTVTNKAPVISKLSLGSAAGITVDKSVPFFGGKTYSVSLPAALPVSAVIEDNKIKIGINIKKKNLYSYNSTEGNTTTTYKKKSMKEQFEDFKKNAYKAELMAKDQDWLRNIQDEKFLDAHIPGFESAVTVDAVGYLEAAWHDDAVTHLQNIEGSVVITVKGTGTLQTQVVLIVIPVTVNCEITAKGTVSASVGYNFDDAKWYGDVELGASLALEPYAGIGIGKHISGGVYGRGESELSMTLISSKEPFGVKKWTLTGEMGLKGYVAQKSANIPILKPKEPFTLYDRDDRGNSLFSASEDESEANYFDEENILYATLDTVSSLQSSVVAGDGVLVTDAYNAAKPLMVSAGGTKMVLYVADDSSRPLLDQTKLVYSIYTPSTGTYSEPMSVLDDGTADYGPEVYTDGKDIYVVWLDSSRKFTDDPEFVDYVSCFKTHVAKYNASTNSFEDLGSPQSGEVYTYLPRLYKNADKLSLAWVENSSNTLFGLSGDNTIYRSTYEGGKWSTTTQAGNVNAVTSMNIGEADAFQGVLIAYAVDKDNDLTTSEHNMYIGKEGGGAFVAGEGNISSISFTSLPGVSGKVAAANVNGAVAYVDGNSLVQLFPEGTMSAETDFVVYGNNVLYLAYSGDIRNIAVASYDGGSWGTSFLTHEDGYVDSFSVADGNVVYLLNIATPGDDNIWNLTSTIKVLGSTEYSDTELESVDFALNDACAGAVLPIEFYIKNNGTGRVNKVHASVKYGESEISSADIDVDIKPGESKPYAYEFILPSDISSNSDLELTVTSAGDENLKNDSEPIAISKADLEVSAFFDEKGIKPVLNINVENRGLVDTTMTMTVTDEKGAALFTETGYIQAGEILSYKKSYSGTESQVLTVTVTGSAPEFYEMNNTTWVQVNGTKPEEQVLDDENFVVRFEEVFSDPYAGLSYNSSDKRYETVYTGSVIKPQVTVTGLKGTLKEGTDYSISYSNNTNVDKKNRPAKVTITGKGNYKGKKVLDFYIVPADLKTLYSKGMLNCARSIKVVSGKKAGISMTYNGYALKASDYVISNTGKITADTSLNVTGKGNFKGTVSGISVQVISGKNADNYKIKASIKSKKHIYNGMAQELTYSTSGIAGELTVTAGKSRIPLKAGTDYTVKYISNVNAGTAKAIVTGTGDYFGTATVSFKIQPDKTAKVIAAPEQNSVLFEAGGVTPKVTVKADGISDELKEGKDYKVTYSNNKKIGTGKYTVTFIGNYKGHAPVKNGTFTITAGSFSDATAQSPDLIYSKPGKYISEPLVSIGGVQLTKKDYTVRYYDSNTEINSKTKVAFKSDETSRAITVKVTGKGNFMAQEITTGYLILKAETINLTKAKIVAKEKVNGKDKAVSAQEYTGKEIKPEIRVLVKNGKNWTEVSEDAYTVYYIGNVQKGKATILVKGKDGLAAGSKSVKFSIGAKNIGFFKLLFG